MSEAGAARRAVFAEQGFVAPLDVLSREEAEACRRRLEDALAASGGVADVRLRNKPHLLFPWMAALVRDRRVVDPVADLLGPDLLVLKTTLFVKAAGDRGYNAWHQDTAFWDLSEDRVVTAWIALTDSTTANGCVRVVSGSHRDPPAPHRLTRDRNNRLLRGQLVGVAIDPERVRTLELRAGQMSLHDGRLLHGSPGNPSATLRAGLAVRYIRPEVRQRGPREGATLVSGTDRFGNYDHEPAPRYDFDPVARAWHVRSLRRYAAHVAWQILRRPSSGHLALLLRLAARRDLLRALR
jgi:ectoine hydroxylase-related dioxygenase (phytanoyl-CoA dioxygenase family)